MQTRARTQLTLLAIYISGVILCVALAFDFQGAINASWMLALIVLTLPWSIISLLFVWPLIHGAGLEYFTMFYLACAGLNVYALDRVMTSYRRSRIGPLEESERQRVVEKTGRLRGKRT
jgi:hypothetical protein